MITIQNQNFGVEIELTGITRQAAAQVIECWSECYPSIGGICGISIIVTKIKED